MTVCGGGTGIIYTTILWRGRYYFYQCVEEGQVLFLPVCGGGPGTIFTSVWWRGRYYFYQCVVEE
jgi:hypothetical protein